MFTEQTNKPLQDVIKTYLRLKDKKSFPLMLKLPIVSSQLKELVIKKTKIPQDDLIIMYQGKQMDFKNKSELVRLKDKSILHVINKKNIRNDIIELLVRFILRNQEKSCLGEAKLFAKPDQSIQDFIEKQAISVIKQITNEKLSPGHFTLVSNGTAMQKTMKFHNYLIQNGAEVFCMINYEESLQKYVNNLSTHKIIASHREMQQYHQATKKPQQKKQQVFLKKQQKQQHKAEPQLQQAEFLKLLQLHSQQLPENKQNKLSEDRTHSKEKKKKLKLKKRDRITSKVASNYQSTHKDDKLISTEQKENQKQESSQKPEINYENPKIESTNDNQSQTVQNPPQKIENRPQQGKNQPKENRVSTLPQKSTTEKKSASKQKSKPEQKTMESTKKEEQTPHNQLTEGFKDLLNYDIVNGFSAEKPNIPFEFKHPKVQEIVRSKTQPKNETSQTRKKTQKQMISQKPSKQVNSVSQQNAQKQNQQENLYVLQEEKKKQFQHQKVRLGDFILTGQIKISEKSKRKEDFIAEMSRKFELLLNEERIESQVPTAQFEQPKIQKKVSMKAGDLIICGNIFKNSSKQVNQKLIQGFNKFLQQDEVKGQNRGSESLIQKKTTA